MMADVAVATDGTETPEAAAAGEGSQAEQSGGGGEAGGSQQPQAETQPDSAAQGEQPEGEQQTQQQNMVPWAEFRKARTRGTQIQREYETARTQWEQEKQQLETRLQELEQGRGASSQVQEDYNQLVGLLRANPDVYNLLEERARTQGPVASAPGANGAQARQVEIPPEMKKWGETTERLEARLREQEERQQQAEQRQQYQRVEQQLQGMVKEFLGKKGYTDDVAPLAFNYLVQRIEETPDMDFTDVPFVLNEWYGTMEKAYQARQNALLRGKSQDAALPPSPGGSQGPIRQTPQPGANDEKTAQHFESELRRRLGW